MILDPRNMPDLNCFPEPPDQFLFCFAATQVALQVHQELSQVVNSTKKAQKCINMIKAGHSITAVWSLLWFMGSRIQMDQLTSTTQSKMSMISCSQPLPLVLWILSASQAQRSMTGRSRYDRLAMSPFPRTRILSTSGVAVLCTFSLDWMSWWGMYLISFLQLHQVQQRLFSTAPVEPRRLFSTAIIVMTEKCSCLTCDNMEELVYLHEVWSQVWGWEVKRGKTMRLAWFFLNQWNTLPFCRFLSLVFWLWDFIWVIVTLTLAHCFSSLFFPLHAYTYYVRHIHIVTIIVYFISWYWQNQLRPEFWLNCLLLPLTQSWHFTKHKSLIALIGSFGEGHKVTAAGCCCCCFVTTQQVPRGVTVRAPPKNGEIARPNTRVVKCNCTFHKRQTSTILRTFDTIS